MASDYWKRCIYLQPDHYEALCHLALLAEANNDAAAPLRSRRAPPASTNASRPPEAISHEHNPSSTPAGTASA
jgi:hypothetical protein